MSVRGKLGEGSTPPEPAIGLVKSNRTDICVLVGEAMREIHLGVGNGGQGSGHIALVSDARYELVSQFSWHACKDASGHVYAQRMLPRKDGRQHGQYMHCLIMGTTWVDHIDGNGLNNQDYNLRVATNAENQRNSVKRAGTSSLYKGVYLRRESGKWQARIKVNGHKISLGCYTVEEDAARAYDSAAKVYFGGFARLNFQDVG